MQIKYITKLPKCNTLGQYGESDENRLFNTFDQSIADWHLDFLQ